LPAFAVPPPGLPPQAARRKEAAAVEIAVRTAAGALGVMVVA
jgi:hypothetical protein